MSCVKASMYRMLKLLLTVLIWFLPAIVFREQYQRAGLIYGPVTKRHPATGGCPSAGLSSCAVCRRSGPSESPIHRLPAGRPPPPPAAGTTPLPPPPPPPPPLPTLRRRHAHPVQLCVEDRQDQSRAVPQRVPPVESHLLVFVPQPQ